MAIITVQGFTKQFGTQIVLDNVTLSINTGEAVGVASAAVGVGRAGDLKERFQLVCVLNLASFPG